ncbi:MAG: PAS domain-containing protein [Rhodospirillaceae bacterium]|nr:PAS domain-containing protein [Rhodospirillaceae bacterium]
MDSLPFYAYVKDNECRLIFSNRLHRQELFGIETNAEAAGKSDFDFFPQKEAQAYYDAEQQMLDSRASIVDQEVEMADPDDGMRWHLNNKQPVYDAAGSAIGLVGYTSDITAQKRGDAERQRQSDQLHRHPRALKELRDAVDHKLEIHAPSSAARHAARDARNIAARSWR